MVIWNWICWQQKSPRSNFDEHRRKCFIKNKSITMLECSCSRESLWRELYVLQIQEGEWSVWLSRNKIYHRIEYSECECFFFFSLLSSLVGLRLYNIKIYSTDWSVWHNTCGWTSASNEASIAMGPTGTHTHTQMLNYTSNHRRKGMRHGVERIFLYKYCTFG